MRLAAQAKLGFYPAPADAIDALAKHLVCTDPAETRILDPCCGKGEAIKQLSEALAIPQQNVYCVELDAGRGSEAKANLPKATVLAPCSFFGTQIDAQKFGCIYCNPPFDDELGGGGREEEAFVRTSYRLLCTGGVLVLVAPYNTLAKYDVQFLLDTHFRDGHLYRFPMLKFNECVFIGLKRSLATTGERALSEGLLLGRMHFGSYRNYNIRGAEHLDVLGQRGRVLAEGQEWASQLQVQTWSTPTTWKPTRFLKAGYTPEELIRAVAGSRLNRLIEASPEPPLKQPPLPLAQGHVAILLASGTLDGLVRAPGWDNHVVRGVTTKETYYNEEASDYTVDEDGEKARVKDVYSERMERKIRAVDSSGTIYSFTMDGCESTESTVVDAEVSKEDLEIIRKLKKITVANNATLAEEVDAKCKIADIKAKYKQTKTGTTG